MKVTSSNAKKKSDAAFSDARKVVIDRMVATTRVVNWPFQFAAAQVVGLVPLRWCRRSSGASTQ
jgi:hypothetical protein